MPIKQGSTVFCYTDKKIHNRFCQKSVASNILWALVSVFTRMKMKWKWFWSLLKSVLIGGKKVQCKIDDLHNTLYMYFTMYAYFSACKYSLTYKVKSLPFNSTTAQSCRVASILRPISNSTVYDAGCIQYTTSCRLGASEVLVWLFVW